VSDSGHTETKAKLEQSPKLFNRFSDKVTLVSFGTVLTFGGFLVSNTWRAAEKYREIEYAFKSYSDSAVKASEERASEKYDEIKEDLGDIKDDIRDLRTQIIKIYGRSGK